VLSVAEHPTAVTYRPAERFDDLFRQFYPRLVPLADRLLGDRAEAEDIVQETFLRLARSGQSSGAARMQQAAGGPQADLADPDDGGLLIDRPDEVVGAWLRRVLLNLGVNRLRDRRRAVARIERATRLDGALDPARGPADDDSPPHALLRAEARDEVRAALAALPERQRACLLLRHAGHSYAEIAATLGIAIGSVGVYLARGERAFRAAYCADDPETGPDSERGTTP
jgi:RNA polymerase sigma-70 factor (ECF subfamily)